MSKQQRDLAKESHWREILELWKSSGLSARAFCRQENLSENSFYAWRRTIRERDNPIAQFVPATISDEPAAGGSIALELAEGYVLRLPAAISATRVAALVHALEMRGPR